MDESKHIKRFRVSAEVVERDICTFRFTQCSIIRAYTKDRAKEIFKNHWSAWKTWTIGEITVEEIPFREGFE